MNERAPRQAYRATRQRTIPTRTRDTQQSDLGGERRRPLPPLNWRRAATERRGDEHDTVHERCAGDHRGVEAKAVRDSRVVVVGPSTPEKVEREEK